MIVDEASDGFFTSANSPMNPPFDGNSLPPFSLACKDGLPEGVQTIDSSSKPYDFAIPNERRIKTSIDSQNTLHGLYDMNSPQLPNTLLKNPSTLCWIVYDSSAFSSVPPSFETILTSWTFLSSDIDYIDKYL